MHSRVERVDEDKVALDKARMASWSISFTLLLLSNIALDIALQQAYLTAQI